MSARNACCTTLAGICILAVLLVSVILPEVAAAGPVKQEVCHIPPDDPFNFHTITISPKAWGAHEGHGDLDGACNGVCASLCDDANACTIDDTGDCEFNGCPLVRAPVDCDDGDPLTEDSCSPASGCVNVCMDGYTRDPVSGDCVLLCPAGEVYDPVTMSCVSVCAEGETWDPDAMACVAACPCFDLAAFGAALSTQDPPGNYHYCGDLAGYPYQDFGPGAEGYVLLSNDLTLFALAGFSNLGPNTACTSNFPPEALGAEHVQSNSNTTSAQDAACRALFEIYCDL